MAGQSSVDRFHSWPHVEVHQIQPNEMPLEEALQKGEQNLTTKLMAVLANLKSNKRIT
jgi:glycerate kinase